MAHELGLYRKPGKPDRTARTPSEAVQYTWDGYKHVKAEDAPSSEVQSEQVEASAPPATDAEKVAAAKAEASRPKPQAGVSNTAPRS